MNNYYTQLLGSAPVRKMLLFIEVLRTEIFKEIKNASEHGTRGDLLIESLIKHEISTHFDKT